MEIGQNISGINPVFEVWVVAKPDESSSGLFNKSDISDLILLSMEKEEEKVMEKNKAMKKISQKNEGNHLWESLLKSNPEMANKPKPDIKDLAQKWVQMMSEEPQHHASTDKSVQFAAKLIVNEEMLDQELLERIRHNLEYNDDRIFENFLRNDSASSKQ